MARNIYIYCMYIYILHALPRDFRSGRNTDMVDARGHAYYNIYFIISFRSNHAGIHVLVSGSEHCSGLEGLNVSIRTL